MRSRRGPARPPPSVGDLITQHAALYTGTADTWIELQRVNGGCIKLPPKGVLQAIVVASVSLARSIQEECPTSTIILRHLWSDVKTCAALLQLQALSLRCLPAGQLAGKLLHLINALFIRLVFDGNGEISPLREARTAVSLALRMDVLPAASAALAAFRLGEPRFDPFGLKSILRVLSAVLRVAHQQLCEEAAGMSVTAEQRAEEESTASLLQYIARSWVLEQIACTIVRGAGWLCSTGAAARPGSQGLRRAPAPDARQRCPNCLGGQGATCENAVGLFSSSLYFFAQLLAKIPARRRPAVQQAPAVQVPDGGGEPDDDALARSGRAIAFGPCLQYGMAAHVVAQLVAADGGELYGLTEEQMLSPLYSDEAPPGGSPGSGRQQQQPVLDYGGVAAAMMIWDWCLQQQTPEMPPLPFSTRAIRQLGLRVARVTTHSGELKAAARRQGGEGGQQQQVEGGPAPALVAQLDDLYCGLAALRAIRCVAACYQSGGDRRQQGGGDGGGGGVDVAAAAEELWGVAVPALHMLISLSELGIDQPYVVAEIMELDVFSDLATAPSLHWLSAPDGDSPPASSPPPSLAAALAAGYIPLLERALRSQQRYEDTPSTAGAMLSLPLLKWRNLGPLLAYGDPGQVAALLATVGKLLRRCVGPSLPGAGATAEPGAAAGCSGSSSGRIAAAQLAYLNLPWDEWLSCAMWVAKQPGAAAEAAGGSGSVAGVGQPPLVGPPQQQQLLTMAVLACQLWLPSLARMATADTQLLATADMGEASVAMLKAAPGSGMSRWLQPLMAAYAIADGRPQLRRSPLPSIKLMAAEASAETSADASAVAAANAAAMAAAEAAVEAAAEAAEAVERAWVKAAEARVEAAKARAEAAAETAAEAAEAAAETAEAAAETAEARVEAATAALRLRSAAEALRWLLLGELNAVAVVGSNLRRLTPQGWADAPSGWKEGAAAADALSELFPDQVAAALHDGTMPSLSAVEAHLRERGESGGAVEDPGGGAAMTAAVRFSELAGRAEESGDDALSYAAGARLLSTVLVLQQGGGGVAGGCGLGWSLLRTCCNPGCGNLQGDSEAALRLSACVRCRAVWYCCKDCQTAHWKAGHKQRCGAAREGGAAAAAAPAAGAGATGSSA